jgi:hypothetical protein
MRPLGLAALLCTACLQDRLSVDITTHVHPDGSCRRRLEYRLERVDTERGDRRTAIAPEEDVLRLLHRLPSGEGWTVEDRVLEEAHVITAEACLPSCQEADGDYERRKAAGSPYLVRNHMSFLHQEGSRGAGGRIEYMENFVDPVSPFQYSRRVAQILGKRDDLFARELVRVLPEVAPVRRDLERAFRESYAEPLARGMAAFESVPVWGPRERQALEDLWERFGDEPEALLASLGRLAPAVAGPSLAKAAEAALTAVFEAVEAGLEREGLPGFAPTERELKVRYRATLTLPYPILRANTCAVGDTATWEFSDEDLFGRGFEMWAVASAPPPVSASRP